MVHPIPPRVQRGRPPRPVALPVLAQNIPEALRVLPQWVLWKYVWKPARGRAAGQWTKVPFTVGGKPADSTDPSTWSPFEDVLDAYERGGWDGVGFVPRPEDGLSVIDLDHCRNRETGELEPWAAAIAAEMDTYTEVTPSATGPRLSCRGRKPDRERSKSGNVEIYDGATAKGKPGRKYLTFTGHRLANTPADVCDRPAQLAAVYERELKAPGRKGHGINPFKVKAVGPATLSDDELIARASQAKNGEKFRRLWAGDTAGYPSPSEADEALCCILAFWTDRDPARMDRLYRRSGLHEKRVDKWGRQDYRERTIARAMELCRKTFGGGDPAPGGSPPPADPGDGARLDTRSFDGLRPQPVEFLVDGYIALGKVTLLAGLGGIGKSTVTLHLAAALTAGRAAFGLKYDPPPPADVLLCFAEDDPEDTVLPRLLACGADPKRVHETRGVGCWYCP